MARRVLRHYPALSARWHWVRWLVTVLLAATCLVTGCGGPLTGVGGESASQPLPHTVTHLSPSTTGAVSEFRLSVPPSGQLPNGAKSLTAGPDGALWFTEVLTGRIGRLTPDGTLTEFTLPRKYPGLLTIPEGMTLGPDKALWFTILDSPPTFPARVGRLTPTGALTLFALPPAYESPILITTGPDGALWVGGNQV